jgi:radical SAM superfamily enzyme YgiQ (UPF0313 family)
LRTALSRKIGSSIAATGRDMSQACNVLLVYPRFDNPSFWDLTAVCEIVGRRRINPPLGLITVAALLPPEWTVRLIDRNAEELTDSDLAWADLVMTGGMLPQQPDTLRVVDLCNARDKPVAVGGPDVMSSPHAYDKADIRVIGEAEGLMGEFVRAWNAGQRRGVFEAEKFKTDVTTSPAPRFDLLKLDYYVDMSVQFSRGCPFTCEFCDIIELYGRVPRTKTTEQMLAELDALYALGHAGNVLFVDDNLIGNKKAVKGFLPHLCEWQKRHGYPFTFSTQASINMADDDALLALMREANFTMVFIGIETSDDDALVTAQKKQNTRRNLAACIHKIHESGMTVAAGFIIGFDGEKNSLAEDMVACIEATDIPLCMVGLLTALPQTQLTRRLRGEGRLLADPDTSLFDAAQGGDQCTAGLNFETSRPRRDILNDYRAVLERTYEPAAYFERVRRLGWQLVPPSAKAKWRPKAAVNDLRTVGRFLWRVLTRHPELIRPLCSTIADCTMHNPAALKQVVTQMIVYLHAGPFARYVVAQLDIQLAKLDADDRGNIAGMEPVAIEPLRSPVNAGKAVAATH